MGVLYHAGVSVGSVVGSAETALTGELARGPALLQYANMLQVVPQSATSTTRCHTRSVTLELTLRSLQLHELLTDSSVAAQRVSEWEAD